MSIKTILACLTSDSSADAVMTAACALARRHDAHLIGLRTIEALMVYPGIAMHIPDSVHDDYGFSQLEQTQALKAIFEKHTHAEQFVSEWRMIKTGMAMAADRIVESAGSADIVVIRCSPRRLFLEIKQPGIRLYHFKNQIEINWFEFAATAHHIHHFPNTVAVVILLIPSLH